MDDETFTSYSRHPDHFGWNIVHTTFMVLAWCFALPVAIMLSMAGSRYRLRAQVVFHGLNGLGILTGIVYDASTPDLYPHDSHRGMGWTVVSLAVVWTMLSIYTAYGNARSIPALGREEFQTCQRRAAYRDYYHAVSRVCSTDFSREPPSPTNQQPAEDAMNGEDSYPHDDHGSEPDERRWLNKEHNIRIQRFLSLRTDSALRTTAIVRISQVVLEKLLLPLGFTTLTSGFIVCGGLFRKEEMLNGLAHMIKGGIFFWYGILTLGRWIGAFAEVGWAWNIRPSPPPQQQQQGLRTGVLRWKEKVPSAEFVESLVIWLYGASNVFLEHLSGWGGEWTARDLEHVSITLLFFGGGMLGMLVESKWVPPALEATVEEIPRDGEGIERLKTPAYFDAGVRRDAAAEHQVHERHRETQRRIPLNPMPALTIMLLGSMMGAHHQASEVSTKLHAQWGKLFIAFALLRGVTYITLYLKPPTSCLPSRPPTEIVTSFCLCAGGVVLMTSASEVVETIEANGLDASAVSMACMGLASVILAWEIVVWGIKGWAARKEREGEAGDRLLHSASSQSV
ncbi:hypothetical protein KC343_g7889 [Hortaea werneckii]|uniref:Integral membrane protein n=1 Tax=Hortaea werneckii TaxID=91943 RepID=A0A3M7FJY3_HORWE|nr:hypothetical protein KC352_g23391 [Hortaea werneckii]KAI7562687.1 hypothetical protein KC317_g8244 [Hortaea werneckii]KAI7612413.1 hypothetical protein KC346_g7844 [Hortaea werneckii]KAI7621746.1 hypothetical protein KC343_g7889 [Hortaea werneckii]KAI7663671.1 hypothetical protein KC319_g7675 [Hortaea werneckii]